MPTITASGRCVERHVLPEGNKSISPTVAPPFPSAWDPISTTVRRPEKRYDDQRAGLPWVTDTQQAVFYLEEVKSRLQPGSIPNIPFRIREYLSFAMGCNPVRVAGSFVQFSQGSPALGYESQSRLERSIQKVDRMRTEEGGATLGRAISSLREMRRLRSTAIIERCCGRGRPHSDRSCLFPPKN
jgi:hypothetical protein